MSRSVITDSSGVLIKMAKRVVSDTPDYEALKKLRFLFTWYLGEEPQLDHEKTWIVASVKKLPNRERDVYNKDVEFRFNKMFWEEFPERDRYRTVWHELRHIQVKFEEDFTVKVDKDGRIDFTLLPHDVIIKTFQVELEKFGLAEGHVHSTELLTKAYQAYKKKQKV